MTLLQPNKLQPPVTYLSRLPPVAAMKKNEDELEVTDKAPRMNLSVEDKRSMDMLSTTMVSACYIYDGDLHNF